MFCPEGYAMKKLVSASFLSLTFGSFQALANINTSIGDFQINGFLSVGMAWTNVEYLQSGIEPVYNSYVRKRPSFEEDSDVGVQITKQLREDISITTQFLALASENWDVEAVWAFIKWEPNDNWQFRAGRVRTNPYMLSEYVNVGYAYPWIRPPEEVYSQVPSSFSNLTGLDARFRMEILKRDLTLSAFYGATSTHLNFPTNLAFPTGINETIFDNIRLRLRDLYSLNLKFGDEVFSIRAGYETTRVTLDPNAGTAMQGLNTFLNSMALFGVPFLGIPPFGLDYVNYFSAYNSRADFMGLGYQFDWKNVVSMGEIVKRKTATPIIANVIGWYLMGGYRFNQMMPHITFARERVIDNKIRRFPSYVNAAFTSPFIANSPVTLDEVAYNLISTGVSFEGGAGSQSSVTLGLRWDIFEGIAIKGEFKHIHPDNRSPGLFNVNPQRSVNLYSVAVDAVM